MLKKQSGQSVINRKKAEIADLADKEQEQAERLQMARNKYILAYPDSEFYDNKTANLMSVLERFGYGLQDMEE